ncbi:hypothetical protein PIROE2DRAFT_50243, partial [Piromyces sp. E2]
MYACKNGNYDIVSYLIDNGANVNLYNIDQQTALMYACKERNLEIVKYLIDHGADINIRNRYQNTAFDILIDNYDKDIHGDLYKLVIYFVEHGMSIDQDISNHSKQSLLMYACENDNVNMMKFLLSHNIDTDMNSKQWIEKSAFLYSCNKISFNMIKYLTTFGIDINIVDENKNNAIHILINHHDVCKEQDIFAIVQYLVENGLDINAINNIEILSLIEACIFNDTHLVKYLIYKGAQTHIVNNKYGTPLI